MRKRDLDQELSAATSTARQSTARSRSCPLPSSAASSSTGVTPARSRSEIAVSNASSHPGDDTSCSAWKYRSPGDRRSSDHNRRALSPSSPAVATIAAPATTCLAASTGVRNRVPTSARSAPIATSCRLSACACASPPTSTVRSGSTPTTGNAAMALAHSGHGRRRMGDHRQARCRLGHAFPPPSRLRASPGQASKPTSTWHIGAPEPLLERSGTRSLWLRLSDNARGPL